MKIRWKMGKQCYGKLLFDLRHSAPLEALLVPRQTETSVVDSRVLSLFFSECQRSPYETFASTQFCVTMTTTRARAEAALLC